MNEFLILLFFAGLLTLIGHGVWVLAAKLFRWLGGKAKKDEPQQRRPAQLPAAPEAMIQRLMHAGKLDAETGKRVLNAIRELQREAEMPPKPNPPLPAPPSVQPPPPSSTVGVPPPLPRARVSASAPPPPILPVSAPVTAPGPQKKPEISPTWKEGFNAFLEQRHIRWGELTGGLLIVGCSAALVLTFWSHIAGRWLAQALVFSGVTASLHGMGHYARRRWQLPDTTFGLLLIALLLTPLSFLLLSALGRGLPAFDATALVVETLALLGLGFLQHHSLRGILPRHQRILSPTLLAQGLWILLLRRFASPGLPLSLTAVYTAIPIAIHAIGSLFLLRRETAPPSSPRLFLLAHALGVYSMALPVVLVLHLVRIGSEAAQLALLLALAGLPTWFLGLHLRRSRVETGDEMLPVLVSAVSFLGFGSVLAALVIAWPMPAALVPCLLLSAAVLLHAGLREQLPHVGLPAGLFLGSALCLTAVANLHPALWNTRDSMYLVSALLSDAAGRSLALLAPLIALAGIGIRRRATAASPSRGILHSAAVQAAAAWLLLVVRDGGRPGDPEGLLSVSAFYGVTLLAAPWIAWLPDRCRMGDRLARCFVHAGLLLAAFTLYRIGSDVFGLDRHSAALAPSLLAVLLHLFLWFHPRAHRLHASATLRLFALCLVLALTPGTHTRVELLGASGVCLGVGGLLLAIPGRRLALFLFSQCLIVVGLCLRMSPNSTETALPHLAIVAFNGATWMLVARALRGLRFHQPNPRLRRLLLRLQSLLRLQDFDAWVALLLPPVTVALFAWDSLSGILHEIQGGPPPTPMESSGLFLAVLAAMGVHLAGRRHDQRLAVFAQSWQILCLGGLALVFARLHAADNAMASALRWNLSLLLALCFVLRESCRRKALWILGFPLWGLHGVAALLAGPFPECPGPGVNSIFLLAGPIGNQVLPLGLLTALVFTHALRRQQPRDLFLAALFGNLNLWIVLFSLPLRLLPHPVIWTQLSAAWCGIPALLWLWKRGAADPFARAQCGLAFAWGLAGLLAALADLLFLSDAPYRALALSSEWIPALWILLWAALALRLGTRDGLRLKLSPKNSGILLAGILLPASVLLSLRFLPGGILLARHVLPLALLGAAGLTLLLAPTLWRNADPHPSRPLQGLLWIPFTLAAAVLLPLLARMQLPSLAREWTATPLAGVFALLLLPPILSITRNLEALYGSPNRWLFPAQGVLWMLAVFLRLTATSRYVALPLLQDLSWAMLPTCAIAFALQRRDSRVSLTRFLPIVSLPLSLFLVLLYDATPNASGIGTACALLAASFPAVLALWDTHAPRVVMRLHTHSLIACLFSVAVATLSVDAFLRAMLLLPGALSLAWTGLYRIRHLLRPVLLRLRIHPPPPAQKGLLLAAMCLSALQLLIAALYLGWTLHARVPSLFLRVAPLIGLLATSAAIGGLARSARVRTFALTLATFALQLGLWSATATLDAPLGLRWLLLPLPFSAGILLLRQYLSASSFLRPEWKNALRSVARGWWAAGLSLLVLELLWTALGGWTGQVPHAWVFASAAAIAVFAALHLRWALCPGGDLPGWIGTAATRHVYTAELLAIGFFLHLRLYWPGLFQGWFEPWWPAILMGLAFLGFGLGELFGRRGPAVLHKPLLRTGLFLPLFPLLSFWIGGGALDQSLVFLLMGVLYAAASGTRGSYGFALLAVLATNSALWNLLSRGNGLDFLRAPQLWILPPAFSVLLASRLHSHRLTPATRGTIRYLCLGVIYLSTSSELFARGVANAPWLPLLLCGLSVMGILTGILLRIRSYLFCGAAFLVLSIFSMLLHASTHLGWTWIWYVAGIAAGLLLILLFAGFERQRHKRLSQLREWDP